MKSISKTNLYQVINVMIIIPSIFNHGMKQKETFIVFYLHFFKNLIKHASLQKRKNNSLQNDVRSNFFILKLTKNIIHNFHHLKIDPWSQLGGFQDRHVLPSNQFIHLDPATLPWLLHAGISKQKSPISILLSGRRQKWSKPSGVIWPPNH